jgi:hypothetical protein
MTKEYITKAHYPDGGCQCEGGGCSACDAQNNELQFASMKEIEEFYDINSEDMYVDPGELDLENIEEYLDE